MALEIKLQQKQIQSLVMTPQLQQAIKLLQLGHQEYVEVITSELLENPTLEEVHVEDAPSKNLSEDNAEKTYSESDHSEINFQDNIDGDASTVRRENKTEEFEFNGLYYEQARKGNAPEDAVSALEGSISAPVGLSSHLMWQLQTSDLSQDMRKVAVHIVCNLDHNGFLASEISEIAEECAVTEDEVEDVLRVVQHLDPVGVGSRSLRECLMVQLDYRGLRDTLAWNIVDLYLREIELRNFDQIAKQTGANKEEVFEALRVIQKLEPRPARSFTTEPAPYITPDVYVKKVGRDYVISLNEAGLPRLKVNPEYQQMLEKGSALKGAEKEYLLDKVRSAQWLIKSILQRQQTIYKVTESIMNHQKDFLEQGISGMKPLVLRDIAADVKLHESTISRVTSNKYVHTPHGVFELKFFFSSGLSSGGGDVSSEVVKERIRDIVSKEDPKKPLSDQQLVKLLQAEGLEIARRTVAKYREMSGILSSSRRKKVF